MNRTWTLKLCVPLAAAALLAGCTQEVGDRAQNRTPIDHATDQQKQNPEVSLTGCVTTGVGTNQFMLRDVRQAPLAQQPTDALSATNSRIPENTPIRLAIADADEIEKLVGETVSVTGRLSDGRNTIGTTGEPRAANQSEPRTDEQRHIPGTEGQQGIGHRPEVRRRRLVGASGKVLPSARVSGR
jgi:hypothetical protein